MSLRFRIEPWTCLVFTAAGLAPWSACGGQSASDDALQEQPIRDGGGGAPSTDDSGQLAFGDCEEMATIGGGWTACAQGFAHRAEAGQCETSLARNDGAAPQEPSTPMEACTSDADCAHLLYGHCGPLPGSWPTPTWTCQAGCITDEDCSAGQTCYCELPVGRCIAADCSVDADCGEGYLCATFVGIGCGPMGIGCQRAEDECVDSSDCTSGTCTRGAGLDYRVCSEGVGGCGRPFLVGGVARLAGTTGRADWAERGLVPSRLDDLSEDDRRECAEWWTHMARMEHASVAAFARFSLELLALGAPSDLVAASNDAMADELKHAKSCFALASAYARRPLGPSALAVDGCLAMPALRAVLHTTLLEGCIGELIAAAEASELAHYATDATLVDVLCEIAEDESRHAALGWRFLRWALEQGGTELAAFARAVVADETQRAAEEVETCPEASSARTVERLALALPTARWRAALRRDLLQRVVVPCLDATVDEVVREKHGCGRTQGPAQPSARYLGCTAALLG